MSDDELLNSAATQVFEAYAHPTIAKDLTGRFQKELWEALENAGFTLLSVPEVFGGSGGDLTAASSLLRIAGRFNAAIPLAETSLLAGTILSAAGLNVPKGPLTAGPVHPDDEITLRQSEHGWVLSGSMKLIPWTQVSNGIAIVAGDGLQSYVALVPTSRCKLVSRPNLAGEPREDVYLENLSIGTEEVAHVSNDVGRLILYRGALSRSLMMAGNLEALLKLSVRYSSERQQFGRAISQFQVIRHALARLNEEVAVARSAVEAAVAETDGPLGEVGIAVSKVLVGNAATQAARIAHQIHGAMGFTQEHVLHRHTTRLWSWREEFGNEMFWANALGSYFSECGPATAWETITSHWSRESRPTIELDVF